MLRADDIYRCSAMVSIHNLTHHAVSPDGTRQLQPEKMYLVFIWKFEPENILIGAHYCLSKCAREAAKHKREADR